MYLKRSRANNSDNLKARVVILICNTLYITVKYHDYIPKGIQVTGRIAKKLSKKDNLASITATVVILDTRHIVTMYDLLVMIVKYYDNIPKGIQVMERTRNSI